MSHGQGQFKQIHLCSKIMYIEKIITYEISNMQSLNLLTKVIYIIDNMYNAHITCKSHVVFFISKKKEAYFLFILYDETTFTNKIDHL